MTIDWWEVSGRYFGYPQCCIEAFCALSHMAEFDTGVQVRVSKNSGFIPCTTCADKVERGEVMLKDLITNRAHRKTFPHSTATRKMIRDWYRRQKHV